MKLEQVLHALREDKALYNSEYFCYVRVKKEKDLKFPHQLNFTLITETGGQFNFSVELLLSEKWNIVE